MLAPVSLGGIPSVNAKVLVFLPACPLQGGGRPKALRHENACLLRGQNLDYHCHCSQKTQINFQETGGTVTHALQVLHSLQWHQPSKDERALRLEPSPWLATPTHTRYLVVLKKLSQALGAHL